MKHDSGSVPHSAPLDAKYMDRLDQALRDEIERIKSVLKYALVSSRTAPPTQVRKPPQVLWSELSTMRASGDPTFWNSDPNDPNSPQGVYNSLATQFGGNPPAEQIPYQQAGLLS